MQPQKGPDPTPGGLAEQPPNPAHQNPGDERSHTTGTDNGTESEAENTATEADPAASNTPAGDPGLAAWLRSEGCPDDAVVLAGHPHAPPPPMSTPQGMGGLIVDLLDLAYDNRVVAFAASWIPEPKAGDRTLYGEVYLTLSPTTEAETPGTADPDTTVDVQIQLITTRGHQRLIKHWTGLGHDWPQVIAPTTAATMKTSLQD